ncbi:unnamed protein product [Closterium sp. Naga37s-1]|nr:unnamed protein product [Closterium sp. Naga37s-1]
MLNVDGSGVDGLDAGAGQPATGNGAAGLLRGNSPAGEGVTSPSQSESSSGKLASGEAGSGGAGGAGQEYTMEALPTARQVEGAAVCHEEQSFWVNSRLRTVACNASQPLITNAPDMLNNIFVPLYACPFQERLGPWGEGGKWICNVPSAIQPNPVIYSIHSKPEYGFELAASIALHTRAHVFSSSLSAAQQAAVRAEAHVEFHEVGLALPKDAKPTDVSLPDLLAAAKHSYVDVLYLAPDCLECEVAFIRQLNASFGSNPASGLSRSGGLLPFGQIMMLLTNVQQVRQMLEVEYTLENLGYRLFHVETKPNGHLEVAYIHASLVQPPKPADCPVDTAGLKYPDHQQIDDAAVCQAESSFQVNMALRRAAMGGEQPLTLSLAEMKELIYVPLYPCPYEERIGEWGDGGKWVCMLASALRKQPIVYSVGSNEQFAFEQGMAESVRTKAFTFDPFITAAQQAHMRSLPFLHFHGIGVAGEESLAYYHKQNPDYDFKTLAQLMLFLNHTYVDVLKIDCEGCEVAFMRDIARAYGSEPATLAINGGVLPFGQVLMELHQITNTKAMLALLYTFESLGYRLFHVETNPLCLICIEVAYIHDSLLQPANPQACPKAPLNDPATLAKISATGGGGARATDGLPLAEGLDDGREQREMEVYKQQAKSLFKRLSQGLPQASRMSIETGPYFFHYIVEGGVCYLTLCERSYPKKLAFQYLEELQREFEKVNRSQIETVARPYYFIKFDTFIQKTRKQYLDTHTQRNIDRLNDDLIEVQQIMTRNIQDVLGTGEKLDHLTQVSSRLSTESSAYAKKAKQLSQQVRCALPLAASVHTRPVALSHLSLPASASQSHVLVHTHRDMHSEALSFVAIHSLSSPIHPCLCTHVSLSLQALLRKWAPIAIIVLVVVMVFYARRLFYS